MVIIVALWLLSAYRPRLVAQVVDGWKGVDAWDSSVLQPDDQVAKVLILGHAEGVLTNEDKVWLEWPEKLKLWERDVRKKKHLKGEVINLCHSALVGGWLASWPSSQTNTLEDETFSLFSYLITLVPLRRTCMLTLQVPLAWATTLISLNSAWGANKRLERHRGTEDFNRFSLFYISASNGDQWRRGTYLLHFDIIIPVYFLSPEQFCPGYKIGKSRESERSAFNVSHFTTRNVS